jgi:hypothetical protein
MSAALLAAMAPSLMQSLGGAGQMSGAQPQPSSATSSSGGTFTSGPMGGGTSIPTWALAAGLALAAVLVLGGRKHGNH